MASAKPQHMTSFPMARNNHPLARSMLYYFVTEPMMFLNISDNLCSRFAFTVIRFYFDPLLFCFCCFYILCPPSYIFTLL